MRAGVEPGPYICRRFHPVYARAGMEARPYGCCGANVGLQCVGGVCGGPGWNPACAFVGDCVRGMCGRVRGMRGRAWKPAPTRCVRLYPVWAGGGRLGDVEFALQFLQDALFYARDIGAGDPQHGGDLFLGIAPSFFKSEAHR